MELDYLRPRVSGITIEVSSRCNLRCAYCHKADEVFEALPSSNMDMTDEMIGDLYRYCKDNGVEHVTLAVGGETTVVADWQHRIAAFLDDPAMKCSINSNFARVLSEDELAAFTKFKNVQVSFDSADIAMVRKLRSKADLKTIAFNIVRLRQTAMELNRRPFLVVNGTICRDNIGHIEKLAGFCRQLGVDQLMLTDVMVTTEHNTKMPDTLDKLTPAELALLKDQVAAAERILQDGPTSLNVQDHLLSHLDSTKDESETSACRLPWTAPMVMADGRVLPCCGSTRLEVGNVGNAPLADIMNGERARAVRQSIMAGEPIVHCQGCSMAERGSFKEFARDIQEWQGGPARRQDAHVRQTSWPGLLSSDQYPVVLENSDLRIGTGGSATLIEQSLFGLHRCLIDVEAATREEVSFVAKPAGRRRLRLDLAHGSDMVARAHIVLASKPTAEVTIGDLDFRMDALPDGRFKVSAALRPGQPVSHINVTLLREDNAVIYPGDGRSGLMLSDFSLAS